MPASKLPNKFHVVDKLPTHFQFVGRIRAAEMLGCSPQLIDRYIQQKKLTGFRLPSNSRYGRDGRKPAKVVVRLSDLLRLVEENEIQ